MTSRPDKSLRILDALRQQVLDDTFAPGQRLPTRPVLERRFSASSVTIQRVLDRLVEDGFVQARGRNGTFVLDHPAHRAHYGLVIPGSRDAREHWPHFWRALDDEARGMFPNGPQWFTIYDGIEERNERSYGQLLRDVQSRRLAGLIFAADPFYLGNSPALMLPGIPRVTFGDGKRGVLSQQIVLEFSSFFGLALDHIAASGRRRVALLTVAGLDPRHLEHFRQAAGVRGLRIEDRWQQAAVINHPQWSANLVQLLLHAGDDACPDALIITDDNLVESAMHGVMASGVRMPDDLTVVAHANFPWPTSSPLPIKRLGFDVRALLRLCIDHLDRQRRNDASSTPSRLWPCFDHAVPSMAPDPAPSTGTPGENAPC
jgi:DNA-binding LacI/PurR family transcriptional regulator